MSSQELPKGWSEERIKRVADYYDNLSEDELATEIETMFQGEEESGVTVGYARSYLLEYMKLAARAVEKLTADDILELYREARELEAKAKEQLA